MVALDSRLHVFRADLAAESLRGRVEAARYTQPLGHVRVCCSVAALRGAPDAGAGLTSELLYGERAAVYERRAGWAWVQAERDGYVGYIALAALADSATLPAANRVVVALRTYLYARPDAKAAGMVRLDACARLAIDEAAPVRDGFVSCVGGGYVPAAHIGLLGERVCDVAGAARLWLGAPYVWGARSSLGLDCSGLIQNACELAGLVVPRDADMQERAFSEVAFSARRPGDLLFWRGHVGVLVEGDGLLHANAHHMATAIEPLAPALARLARAAGPLRGVRRLETRD